MENIKLAIFDFDGTITDGAYYINDDLQVFKRLHSRDYMGLMLLAKAGIPILILSTSDRGVRREYFNLVKGKLDVFCNVDDKLAFSANYIEKIGLNLKDVAFMGDDVNDIPLLMEVGIAASPSDAHHKVIEEIAKRSDAWTMDNKGGPGAVREFVDFLLF